MKLERIVNIRPGMLEVVFTQDGFNVAKVVRSDDMSDGKHEDPRNLCRQLVSAIREAQRDMAWHFFGKDWRKHVGPFWTTALNEPEVLLLERAGKLRPDLFEVTA